ncbi:MAG: hypothetical protein GY757_31690 [bacterium]|nr:hypothetical protein [bacterium]
MNYFSVPADFKKNTIDEYEKLNRTYNDSRVAETYGSITKNTYLSSGRLVEHMIGIDLLELKEYIAYSKERGIDFNYTVNATHMQNTEFTEEGVRKIKTFLQQLYEVGVRSLTVTMLPLLEIIKTCDYDFKIKASCLCQIATPNKAMGYKSMGFDKIVPDESMNRDFYVLKRIRDAFGEEVELIANQICAIDCLYRISHYNMIAGNPFGNTNETSINFYEHRCVRQRHKSLDNLLKLSWIRPEDLHYYEDIGINRFKLQGRHTFVKGGDPVKTVKCYFDKDFNGNLMDLLNMFATFNSFNVHIDNKKLDGFIKPYVEKEGFCKKDCTKCDYCENYSKKCIDYQQAGEIVQCGIEFYDKYDQFDKLKNSIQPIKNEIPAEEDVEIDFDMD